MSSFLPDSSFRAIRDSVSLKIFRLRLDVLVEDHWWCLYLSWWSLPFLPKFLVLYRNCLMSPNTSGWGKVEFVSVQLWKNTSQLKLQLPKATQPVYNSSQRCWDQCHFSFPHRWRNWDKRLWSALNSRCQVDRIQLVDSFLTPTHCLCISRAAHCPLNFPGNI